jgi:hypothetical protein
MGFLFFLKKVFTMHIELPDDAETVELSPNVTSVSFAENNDGDRVRIRGDYLTIVEGLREYGIQVIDCE